jgi:hypothetical protein
MLHASHPGEQQRRNHLHDCVACQGNSCQVQHAAHIPCVTVPLPHIKYGCNNTPAMRCYKYAQPAGAEYMYMSCKCLNVQCCAGTLMLTCMQGNQLESSKHKPVQDKPGSSSTKRMLLCQSRYHLASAKKSREESRTKEMCWSDQSLFVGAFH